MKTTVKIESSTDVIESRQAGRAMAKTLGFGSADQTRLATATSELTRNVIMYAGKGMCFITDESDKNQIKIQVVVEDHGPGIPDIDQAMEQGFSTGGSLGAGLPGTKRLVKEFEIQSKPGNTIITISIARRRL